MADEKQKPGRILFLCHPLTGHLTPALRVAAELRRRGWPVSFLGPTAHRARIVAAGADFLPLRGEADMDDLLYYSPDNPSPPVPGYHGLEWQDRALVDLEKHFVEPIPAQWACVRDALAGLHRAGDHLPVVIINEAFFAGGLPLRLGAPLPDGVPRPRATLCLSVTPPAIRSADLPPFGSPLALPLPPAPDPAHRARVARAWAEWAARAAPLRRRLDERLAEAGAARPLAGPAGPPALLDGANYTCHDAVLQVGVPAFEYPRDDWPPRFRFVGFLPPPPGAHQLDHLPPWWDEVVAAGASSSSTAGGRGGRRVVVVAQGTVETDPRDLVVPTLEAMRGRGGDVLVVAVLGRRGAAGLPPGFDVPANARLADYLPYDAVLPHARAWVHNGGYGAVTHGVAHGVPMVVAGEGQDKTENIRRVRHSGIGVGLATARPSVGDLRLGLDAVLDDERYRTRVGVLRQASMDLDCFGSIEKAVLEALA